MTNKRLSNLLNFKKRIKIKQHLGSLRSSPREGEGDGTLWLRYLPPWVLKSYPVSEWNFQIYISCLGVWLSSRDFLGIYCNANFLYYAKFFYFFYCFKTNCFWGRGKFPGQIAWGKSQQSAEQCIKTQKNCRKELFSKETLTNSCTVCHNITMNMLKTSKLGSISWTKDK